MSGSAVDLWPTVELSGVSLAAISEAEVLDAIAAALDAGRGGWVMTVHVTGLRLVTTDPQVRQLAERADIVVADGMPLVWATALRGTPLPERVAGSNLIWSLTRRAAAGGRTVFLLGGDPGAAEAAAARLRTDFPGLVVAGTLSPPFGFERDPAAVEAIAATLRQAAPDVVYVGLGFPKQELLIDRVRHELPHAWFLGVGMSIGFVAGQMPRAPSWMQRAGLEWFHRLVHEPRRLGPRYVLHDIPFALRMLASSVRARRAARQ